MNPSEIDEIVKIEEILEIHAIYYTLKTKHIQGLKLAYGSLKKRISRQEIDLLRLEAAAEEGRRRHLVAQVKPLVELHPVYQSYLSKIKGIGVPMAMLLLGTVQPRKFQTMSRMWRWLGLAPDQPRKDKRFNRRAKGIVYLVVLTMMKQKGYYYERYQAFRAMEDEKHPELTNRHRYLRALRKTVKLFTGHYWEAYRRTLGLPVRIPYGVERGLEKTYIPPIIDKPVIRVWEP